MTVRKEFPDSAVQTAHYVHVTMLAWHKTQFIEALLLGPKRKSRITAFEGKAINQESTYAHNDFARMPSSLTH
jgi:hypothetical protein